MNYNEKFFKDRAEVQKFITDLHQHLIELEAQGILPIHFDPQKIEKVNGNYRFAANNLFTSCYYDSDSCQPLRHEVFPNNRKALRRFNPLTNAGAAYDINNEFTWIDIGSVILEILIFLKPRITNYSLSYQPYAPGIPKLAYYQSLLDEEPATVPVQRSVMEKDKEDFIAILRREEIPRSTLFSLLTDRREVTKIVQQYLPLKDFRIYQGNNVFVPTKIIDFMAGQLVFEGIVTDWSGTRPAVAKTRDDIKDYPDQLYNFPVSGRYNISYKGKDLRRNVLIMEKLEELPATIDFRKMAVDLIRQYQSIHGQGYCHSDLKPDNIMYKDGKYYLIDLDFAVPQQGSLWFQDGFFAPLTAVTDTDNPLVYEIIHHFSGGETNYRNDMIRLGYLLNYLISKDATKVRSRLTVETTNYLNYFAKMPYNQLLQDRDYEVAISFFSGK